MERIWRPKADQMRAWGRSQLASQETEQADRTSRPATQAANHQETEQVDRTSRQSKPASQPAGSTDRQTDRQTDRRSREIYKFKS